jgi:hypothetical protein
MHIEEITNRVYIDSIRMATEITEAMDEKQVNTSLINLPIDTKKSIVAQYLAKGVILPKLMGEKED